MSRGTKLQEMEQSKTAVNANAAPGDKALPKEGSNAAGVKTPGNTPPFEDLGGPTPENYSPTNDSAKLNTPGRTIKQVSDVVTNRKPPAGKGDAVGKSATPVKVPEEVESEEDVIEETPEVTDEVVTEEELTQEEEYDIEEDVNALFGGEELSEEFKAKAKTIFEAAIGSKVGQIKETLESEYAEKIAEATEDLKVSLQELSLIHI